MNELKPSTRALLELGRNGVEPTERDALKNRRALVARLGAATVLGTAGVASSTSAAATTTATSAAKLSGIIASLVIAGAVATGVVVVKQRASHAPAVVANASTQFVQPESAAPAATATSAGAVDDDRPLAPPAEVPSHAALRPPQVARAKGSVGERPLAPESAASAGVSPRASSALGDEVDLIRAAHEQLHQGNAGAALETLAEHARRFPNGALREERQASRILALCQLGNVAAARAEADRFVLEAPGSPLVDRVRGACRAARSPSR
jgi:hypothetical protein